VPPGILVVHPSIFPPVVALASYGMFERIFWAEDKLFVVLLYKFHALAPFLNHHTEAIPQVSGVTPPPTPSGSLTTVATGVGDAVTTGLVTGTGEDGLVGVAETAVWASW
jgi:hypothetical protein